MGFDYQVAVLGGGPGGYVAAIRCAQLGLKTALIEERELGGTCLNRGCIPTKALLHGAEVYKTIQDASALGISVREVDLQYDKLALWKDRVVARLRRGVEGLENAHGVTILRGRGSLTDAHTLAVGEQCITAESIILATGSTPAKPPIPGIEHAITSDEFLAQTQLPARVILIGGGVIGIEFATLLASLGTSVTILEMLPHILPGVDADIRDFVFKRMRQSGIQIFNSARVIAIDNGSVTYEIDGVSHVLEADTIVVCTGRRPATSGLGLEQLGVKMERGFVDIDASCRTNVPNLYAVGDITGKIQLAHVASAQGLTAAANCAGKSEALRYDVVPACIYTFPEIAYVGMDETTAQRAGHKTRTGIFPVSGNGRSLLMNQSEGFAKIVTDALTGEILGSQIVAPRATDMISEISATMQCEGTIQELSRTIHPHPSVSEILYEAAHDVEGFSCHLGKKPHL